MLVRTKAQGPRSQDPAIDDLAKVGRLWFHDLRHTFASLLMGIRDQLGHYSIRMTAISMVTAFQAAVEQQLMTSTIPFGESSGNKSTHRTTPPSPTNQPNVHYFHSPDHEHPLTAPQFMHL
jgi:hypothetical protein